VFGGFRWRRFKLGIRFLPVIIFVEVATYLSIGVLLPESRILSGVEKHDD